MWQFVKDIVAGLLKFIGIRRQWETEDLAEAERVYKEDIALLQQELEDPETDKQKAEIKREIRRRRKGLHQLYEDKLELLLSRSVMQRMTPKGAISVMQRMTPKGAISSSLRELPPADRQTLELATAIRGALETAKTFDDHFERGNALYAVQDFAKALEEYNAALALRADDPATLNNRGAALAGLKRYEEALADFNRALDLRPNDPGTLYNRGAALGYLKRYEEALADFNRSLQLRPDHPDTLNNRGITLYHLRRYEEAVADCDRSLQLRPDHPDTLNIRGLALGYLQRYDEALASYNRSLELWPDHPDTMYNIACLYSLWERYDESLQWLEKTIARDASCRAEAAEDEDFEGLRNHPEWGPKFWELVGREETS